MKKIKDIVSAICLFFLFLNPALAQTTAAILPEGKTQFLDNNGNPLSSGKVFFYVPSTTTFKTTWQDAAKTTPNTNPVNLDAGGRAIIYGDGTYRQIVRSSAATGNLLIYDALTASTGTGGNTPTSFGDGAAVGSIKPWAGLTPPVNYVYSYGQELSRTTYAALFSAITLPQNISCTSASPILTGLSDTSQIPVGSILETTCVAAGSTVISKTTTTVTMNNNASLTTNTTGVFFLYGNGNGTTTFNVPDLRGNVIAGRCNMGGTDCTNLTVTGLGETASATGAVGGSQTKGLVIPNLPPYTPTGIISAVNATGNVSAPTITLSAAATNVVNSAAGLTANLTGGGAALLQATITAISSAPIFTGTGGTATFTGTAQGGTSTAFSIVQPTMTLNYVIKILPDVSLSTSSVVTSLGTQTGDISCGTWLVCTGNNIAVSINPASAATILMNPSNASGTASLFTIQGLTNQVAPDPNNDFLPLYNAATGTIQRVSAGVLGSIGVSGVSSFNGRVGAVVPVTNDYNSAQVSTIGTGAGATSRTSKQKLNEWVSAADYGAVGDATTDDTAALILADTAASAQGKCLLLAGSTNNFFKVSSTITPSNNACWMGQATSTTYIQPSSTTAIVFDISNASFFAKDFSIAPIGGVVRTASSVYFNVTYAGGAEFNNIRVLNGGISWSINSSSGTVILNSINISNSVTNGVGIEILSCFICSLLNSVISENIATNVFAGISITSVDQIQIINTSVLGPLIGLSLVPNSVHVNLVKIYSTYFDQNASFGIFMSPSSTGTINGFLMDGGWVTGNGVNMIGNGGGNISNVTFINNQLWPSTNINYVLQADGVFNLNLQSNSVFNIATGPGFIITNSTGGDISSNQFILSTNTGIVLNGTTDQFSVHDNNLCAPATKIVPGAGTQNKIHDNVCIP